MAQGLIDSSFQYHLLSAKNNGITKEEITEILTHAAFRMAVQVWKEDDNIEDAKTLHEKNMLFLNASSGGGQILICIAGRGYYQEWGKAAQELNSGDVVNIPAGVKHWHGAAKDSWFSHLAVEVSGTDTSNEWLEAVENDTYGCLK